jgi:hypothetical protein
MSTDNDRRERAAEKLLGGRERIRAKARGETPVEAAQDQYGDDALEATAAALADDIDLTDDLLAAIRDDAELDDAEAAATSDGGADGDDDEDDDETVSANIMSGSEFLAQRRRRRERLEADDTDDNLDTDELALAAMDGDDRVAADQRGLDPAEYIQSEYGLMAAEYDDPDALHTDIMED